MFKTPANNLEELKKTSRNVEKKKEYRNNFNCDTVTSFAPFQSPQDVINEPNFHYFQLEAGILTRDLCRLGNSQ